MPEPRRCYVCGLIECGTCAPFGGCGFVAEDPPGFARRCPDCDCMSESAGWWEAEVEQDKCLEPRPGARSCPLMRVVTSRRVVLGTNPDFLCPRCAAEAKTMHAQFANFGRAWRDLVDALAATWPWRTFPRILARLARWLRRVGV